MTDWIGAHGLVVKLAAQIRGMDLLGDLCLVHGKVTGISRDGERGLVELDVWAEAPAGRKTTIGTATVSLPSRG